MKFIVTDNAGAVVGRFANRPDAERSFPPSEAHIYKVLMAPPPYPGHCLHPEKCAGRGSCPRDMSCID